jgi:hypothetical protein
MKIGFTGTHHGMTEAQKITLRSLLQTALDEVIALDPLDRPWFHHGDCIGSDAQADFIAWELGYRITVWPPTNDYARFFCKAGPPPESISSISVLQIYTVMPPKPYLVRDKDIVNGADKVFATPAGFDEELRSGTWSTIRYARKKKIPITIIWPNGSVKQE